MKPGSRTGSRLIFNRFARYEQAFADRRRHGVHDGFLMAHDDSFCRTVANHHTRVCELAGRERVDSEDMARFLSDISASIPEGTPAGLCDLRKRNMYEYA